MGQGACEKQVGKKKLGMVILDSERQADQKHTTEFSGNIKGQLDTINLQ